MVYIKELPPKKIFTNYGIHLPESIFKHVLTDENFFPLNANP